MKIQLLTKRIPLNAGSKKQTGATLFTSLVFLILMTIVGVSAAKISMLDVFMSGNNQQRMEVFQTTSAQLKDATSVVNLYVPLVDPNMGQRGIWTHTITDTRNPNTTKTIYNKVRKYQCGGFDGEAVSIGPDVPPCYLFDFKAASKKDNGSARDRHNRGAGKEFPNPSKNSYL